MSFATLFRCTFLKTGLSQERKGSHMKSSGSLCGLRGVLVGVPLVFLFFVNVQPSGAGTAETVISRSDAPRLVDVRDVTINGGVVSGEVVNRSSDVLRDVQLQIRSTLYWENERKPGEDTRGDVEYVTVSGPISPGGTARFTKRLGSESVSDTAGHLETQVSVAGFTRLERQNEQARR